MEFSESCLTTSVQAKQCICVERALAGLPHVDGLCEVHHKNPEVIDSYMNHHNYNTDHFAVTDSMQQTERFVLDSAKATSRTLPGGWRDEACVAVHGCTVSWSCFDLNRVERDLLIIVEV